ncbi:A/G-specific adenine glycosylase [Dysgonomonas sp. 520]|nr:A/G-specific adenine glycosylase [Dysgonomonas sp. 520]
MSSFPQPLYADISSALVFWYNANKRDLPWRDTKDPYLIWLSEVILQQTRVDQGLSYYNKFAERFPFVEDLANADEDEVLKLWQGLGYYSRARNLHATARNITDNYNGVFPDNYKTILSLKGVGEYTAAAISSFSFNIPVATVDGNVYRVLSRLFVIQEPIDTGRGKKVFSQLAQEILDKKSPAMHNQAMMEFGALQCVPVSPKCSECPLSNVCEAYKLNLVSSFPVKQGKVTIKNRYFNYFDIRYGEYTYINKRGVNDIWKNLYELPLIETSSAQSMESILQDNSFSEMFPENSINNIVHKQSIKHILSHRVIYTEFYLVEVTDDDFLKRNFLKINISDIDNYAISRLVHKYLENCEK